LNESHALFHSNPIDSSDTSDFVVIICFIVTWRKGPNEFSQELSAFSTETFRVEISRVDFGTDFENRKYTSPQQILQIKLLDLDVLQSPCSSSADQC
jgi:hypothetical protein